jgi:hypothetical protein
MSPFKLSPRHLASVFAVVSLCGWTHAADVTVTWTGRGDGESWKNPANWDPPVVPQNTADIRFQVIIPGGSGQIRFGLPFENPGIIQSLRLGKERQLILPSGPGLTIIDDALLAGILDAQGGNFFAEGEGVEFAGDRARIWVSGGSLVRVSAPQYSSRGLWGDDRCSGPDCKPQTYIWPLFTAKGPGSRLELPLLEEIDAGFDSGGEDHDRQRIFASDNGTIDLSGLKKVIGPADTFDIVYLPEHIEDRLEILAAGGGQILLESLEEIATAGHGCTRICADNATLSLPRLRTAMNVIFEADGGGAVRVEGPQQAVYDTSRLWADDGCTGGDCLPRTYTWTILQATGTGSVLALPSLAAIQAGFDSGGEDEDYHRILASDGGAIDLSGVKKIIAPSDEIDGIGFRAEYGSEILLSSLESISSRLRGWTHFSVNESRLSLGRLDPEGETTIGASGSSTVVHIEGDCLVNSRCEVTIRKTSHLIVDGLFVIDGGCFTLSEPVWPEEGLGGTLSAGSHVLFSLKDEACFYDVDSTLRCQGGGLQILEVGGRDLGPCQYCLGNGNFGWGELVVGSEGRPTTVELQDSIDNGNRGPASGPRAEALYLIGIGGGSGLEIAPGSTLSIDDLNVYLKYSGAIVDIGSLFEPGDPGYPTQTTYPKDRPLEERGTIVRGPRADFRRGDANADGEIDLSDAIFLLSYLFLGGSEPSCRDAGDADDNGSLEITDPISILAFKFQGGRKPAEPFSAEPYPLCGIDPTEDGLDCEEFKPCGTTTR